MEVIFYTEFSKRHNSTKNPESSGAVSVGVTKEVNLKDNCDLISPSFFVADVNKYVYCKAFGWYYFITGDGYDINNAHYVTCKIDVLGTWKTEINNHSAFVKYSSSLFNEFIKDERIATTGKMISKSIRLSLDNYISEEETFMWLLTTYACDEDDLANNGIKSYLFTNAEWLYLIQALFVDGESFFGSLEQSFSDLKDAIIDISCIPFANNITMGAPTNDVIIGKYHTHVYGHFADHGAIIINDGMPLTDLHKSDFRIMEPYTYCTLFLPFIGNVSISPEELQNAGSLFFTIIGNILTRKITYIVYVGSGNVKDNSAKIIGIYHGNFGIQIPLAYLYNDNAVGFIQDSVKAAAGVAMAAGGAIAGNPVVAAMGLSSALTSEVSAFIKANTKSTSMIGGLSGNYGWSNCPYIKLQIYTPEVTEEPINLAELYGRPLLKVKRIGDLSGYCETRGFSFNGSVMDSIRQMINQYMDAGVYLE